MEDNFNEKLNLDDLYKQKKLTQDHKIKIYQRVLARVHSKIKTTSRMRGSEKCTFFLLPEFKLFLQKTSLFFNVNRIANNPPMPPVPIIPTLYFLISNLFLIIF